MTDPAKPPEQATSSIWDDLTGQVFRFLLVGVAAGLIWFRPESDVGYGFLMLAFNYWFGGR